MRDVQNQLDHRNIEIDKVGIRGLKYPIVVRDRRHGTQHTVATVNMYVSLPQEFKGTHMSRFIEILNEYRGDITLGSISGILESMKQRFRAQSAHLEMGFPYFVEKEAPVTRAPSLMEYGCCFLGSHRDNVDLRVGVEVPVTTLCPCSKEISRWGAHNQRGRVKVMVRFRHFFWIEDLIRLVESSASSEVYALLKRADERYVTEQAYQRPMFVEDVVREVALKLMADPNFTWFSVEVENFESIHNHNAYAFIERAMAEGPPSGHGGAPGGG